MDQLGLASDKEPDALERFGGKNLRLGNAQGQVGSGRKVLVHCSKQSRLKKNNKMSSYKIISFFKLSVSPSSPWFFTTFACFPYRNNINLNNTVLLQTELQQALLGGTLWAKKVLLGVSNLVLVSSFLTSLHSRINDDGRIRLVPNHIKFVLQAARDLNQCIAQVLVVQVLLWPRISSMVVGTVLGLPGTHSKILLNPQRLTCFIVPSPPLCCHHLVISCTISPHYWDLFSNNSLKVIMRVMASLIWMFTVSLPSFWDLLPQRDLLRLSPLMDSLDQRVVELSVHHLQLGDNCWWGISSCLFISEPKKSVQPCGALSALLMRSSA